MSLSILNPARLLCSLQCMMFLCEKYQTTLIELNERLQKHFHFSPPSFLSFFNFSFRACLTIQRKWRKQRGKGIKNLMTLKEEAKWKAKDRLLGKGRKVKERELHATFLQHLAAMIVGCTDVPG